MEAQSTAPMLQLEKLAPSKTNPRRDFNESALKELAESIRQHGVLQPILVRPMNGLFEIVAGERRFRAAKMAGLKEIPTLCREISDQEALEMQVVENMQRMDLHPLEEADGYLKLHEKHGYAIDDLAAKVGKSKAYVYARLKLCALSKKAQKAFLDGKLSASVALLVARIPDSIQDKALEDIVDGGDCGGSMSYREATDHIENKFMLQLTEAPFDTKDEKLDPKAGPCTTCPKRTGNQKELFPDIKRADVCTDPPCFEAKTSIWAKAALAEAKDSGQKVVEAKDVDRIAGYGSDNLKLDSTNYDDPKSRNYRTLLRGLLDKSQIILVHDITRNRLHEVVPKKLAGELLKKAGHKWALPGNGNSPDGSYRKQQLREEKLDRAVTAVCVPKVVGMAEKEGIKSLRLLRLMSKCAAFQATNDLQRFICKRRELIPVVRKRDGYTSRDYIGPLLALIDKSESESWLTGILVELLGFGRYGPSSLGKASPYAPAYDCTEEALKHFKVDAKKIRQEEKEKLSVKDAGKKKQKK